MHGIGCVAGRHEACPYAHGSSLFAASVTTMTGLCSTVVGTLPVNTAAKSMACPAGQCGRRARIGGQQVAGDLRESEMIVARVALGASELGAVACMANEILLMCDKLGLNAWEIIEAAAIKPFRFMKVTPGRGLSGHCIPSNPLYLS
jgi:hypothetical protein